MGDGYVAQGKLKEAIIEYRNAVKIAPQSADAHFKLAKAYAQAEDPAKAYQSYARAAELDPARIEALISAGTILLVAGEYQEARGLAERALRSDANSAQAYVLLGNALAGMKNMSRAFAQSNRRFSSTRPTRRRGRRSGRHASETVSGRRRVRRFARPWTSRRNPRRTHRARQLSVGPRRYRQS